MLFFGLILLSASLSSMLMFDILNADGLTLLERLKLPLFFVLFTSLAGVFWTAIAGFVVRLAGHDPVGIATHEASGCALRHRTALAMCIYNEDAGRVAAGVDAIWTSLTAQSEHHAFDLFILSDTRTPVIAAAEEAVWWSLVERHDARGRIFYRRRAKNIGRKAGNVADFVRSWGGAYDYMVILDADSIMTGNALVTLARLMDAHPEIGIIQTLPLPVGRETLFARILQFSARLNAPMLTSGLAFWQLGDSNYWGHNAILRLLPFAAHCALPRLPGAEPLGGEILSHDFVEAALLRRAGYQVWLLPDLAGSWEQVPSNLLDYAARDRRWTQGNLQHLAVLPLRGLHWLSRVHMITGVLSFATSPIWLLALILSSVIPCADAVRGHDSFAPDTYSLFRGWPVRRTGEIAFLLAATVLVLLLPKVLGAVLVLKDRAQRAAFGGTPVVILNLLAEQLFSMLLAPAMMLFHSTFIARTLAGNRGSWEAQARDDRGIGVAEALSRLKWHAGLGCVWGGLILWLEPRFIWWMLPVLAGLLFSVPLTVWTSRTSVGRRARERALFLTPEEIAPPPELARPRAACHVALPDALAVELRVPERVPLTMDVAPFVRISLHRAAKIRLECKVHED